MAFVGLPLLHFAIGTALKVDERIIPEVEANVNTAKDGFDIPIRDYFNVCNELYVGNSGKLDESSSKI